MDLIWVVVGLVLLGVILEWVKGQFKIDSAILFLIRIVICIAVLLMLVRLFGKYIPNVLSAFMIGAF